MGLGLFCVRTHSLAARASSISPKGSRMCAEDLECSHRLTRGQNTAMKTAGTQQLALIARACRCCGFWRSGLHDLKTSHCLVPDGLLCNSPRDRADGDVSID